MPETDKQTDEELDELDTSGRVNFRDYPSSGLVVIAAVSSGLGWMLYRWLGRKRKTRSAAPDPSPGTNAPPSPEKQSADKKPKR